MALSQWQSDDAIKRCLEGGRVAVVGLSSNPARPSFGVAKYLLQVGYEVVPVNPNEDKILGRACYADLQSIPGRVDLVDVFRQSDAVLPIAESAIAIGAQQAGLACVADRCTKIEHRSLSLQGWVR